jgi:thermitase
MARSRRAYLLAVALMVGVLLASSGAAVGQQGQDNALGAPDSPVGPGFESEPDQSTGKDFVPGELVVGLNEGVTNSTQGIERAAEASGGRVVDHLNDPQNRAVLLKFPSEQAAQAATEGLAKRPDVQYVERNGIVEGTEVSSDPQVGFQWHHTVIRKTANLGTLPSAPPTIAVVDSGVDYNHPDLAGKVILGPDYVNNDNDPMDDHSHGTHVAGIAAATAANGQFGEGVSPNSKILAIKVLNASNSGNAFLTAQGLAYARTASTTPETKVINASIGGAGVNPQVVADQVAAIKASGKILVASAGNSNTSETPSYPGADPNTALRVTATNESDCRSYFSNFSPASNPTLYNIAAPGTNIHSTVPNSGFANNSGTSQASPMVAGAAALVWGNTPSLTAGQVVNMLRSTGEKTSCGFAASTPRLDVRKALLGTSETALVGMILDPVTGLAPSPDTTPVTAKLLSGTTLLKSDDTNQSGFYEMTELAAGTGMQLKDTRSGYVSATLRKPISVTSGQVGGPFTDALPQSRPTGNATVTIDWKTLQPVIDTAGCVDACNGWDFNLVVRLPSGSFVEPVAGSQGSLTSAPFVSAPRNSTSDLDPVEGLIIGSQAADGIYKVIAFKWPDPAGTQFNPSWNGSQASVQMYNGSAKLGGGLKKVPSTCGTNRLWYVGDLTKSGNTYTWTNQNLCTNIVP